MAQLTIRIDDGLADDLRREAASAGRSVNAFVVDVIRAATDPELGGSAAERMRARLARAGLLHLPRRGETPAPDPALVAAARRRAGKGTPLSDLVSHDRG